MFKKFLCFTIIAATIFTLAACKPKVNVVDSEVTDVIVYYDENGNPVTEGVPSATLSPEAQKVQLDPSNPEAAPKDYDPTKGKDYSKRVTFDIGWTNAAIDMDKDALGKYVENKFNADFNAKILPAEKIVLLAAQDQLPDFFTTWLGTTTYMQLEQEKFLYHLPRTLIAQYPLLQRYCNNHQYLNAFSDISYDKQYVALPFMNNATRPMQGFESAVYYRKDWAQNVGYDQTIDTVDKEYELMKRFRENDPDKNGFKDTYGFTGFMWSIDWVPWVDTYSWVKETDSSSPYNGMYVPGFVNSKMFGAIQWWNRLLKEQIIPADFHLNGNGMDKLVANQVGVAYGNSSNYWLWEFLINRFDAAHKSYYPTLPKTPEGRTPTVNDVVSEFPPLKLTENSAPRFPAQLETGITCISTKAGQDKVKISRMLDFYEWTISQEGTDFFTYGIKDTDYKVDSSGYAVRLLPGSTTTPGAMKKLWEVYPSIQIAQLVSYEGSTPRPEKGSMYPQWVIDRKNATQVAKDKYAVKTTISINNLMSPAKERHLDAYGEKWFEDKLNRVIAQDGGKTIEQAGATHTEVFLGSLIRVSSGLGPPHYLSVLAGRICLPHPPTGLNRHDHRPADLSLLRHPLVDNATPQVREY